MPELSLPRVAEDAIRGIAEGFELIVVNFANGDVIGHTANRGAKTECTGLVDTQLGKVINAAVAGDYAILVTADHGNLEEMTNADGTPHGSHTTNPVPLLLIDPRSAAHPSLRAGKLADIAPTILQALRLPPSSAMDGMTLAPDLDWGGRSTAPGSAPALLGKLEQQMEEIGTGQIVTGMGRAIALDRDSN